MKLRSWRSQGIAEVSAEEKVARARELTAIERVSLARAHAATVWAAMTRNVGHHQRVKDFDPGILRKLLFTQLVDIERGRVVGLNPELLERVGRG